MFWRARRRSPSSRTPRQDRARELGRELFARHGGRILGGPFAGMQYVDAAVCSMLGPKLLGVYEEELHGVLELLLARPYDVIVDVGCAEGYYAVGLALRLQRARVRAFDIDPEARRLCAELAERNGVGERVLVGGRISADELEELAGPRRLVVCDVEGAELELFPGAPGPNLARSDVLVELHDFFDPSITRMLVPRFRVTHAVTVIPAAAPRAAPPPHPALADYGEADRLLVASEFRPPGMAWLLAVARDAGR